MRLGNVRSHINFRPQSSAVPINCLPNVVEIKNFIKSFNEVLNE